MSKTRPAAVAGYFYPADREELQSTVRHLLQDAAAKNLHLEPKAIIGPHAGYVYSGPIAASVYAQLADIKARIRKVVLLGPAHRLAFAGLAVPSVANFETPLGKIAIDRAGIEQALRFPQVQLLDEAHAMEHSLEVHLPFLQETLSAFTLLPFAVGEASPEEVAEVMEALWGGPETLIVVSTDLSHYHDYQSAQLMDQQTSDAILQLRPQAIDYEQACGRDPVNGLLHLAKKRSLHGHLLDLRNSGDTSGVRDRVVGYGAYAFTSDEASPHTPKN